MSKTKRAVIPDGTVSHSDEEFATSTDRVRSVRNKALKDPNFAAAVREQTTRTRRSKQGGPMPCRG